MSFLDKFNKLGCGTCYLNDARLKTFSTNCSADVDVVLLKENISKLEDKKQEKEHAKYLKELKNFYESFLESIENESTNEDDIKKVLIRAKTYNIGDIGKKEESPSVTKNKIIKDVKRLGRVSNVRKKGESGTYMYKKYFLNISSDAEEKRIISKIKTRIKDIQEEIKNIDYNLIGQEITNIQNEINDLISENKKAKCVKYKKEIEK